MMAALVHDFGKTVSTLVSGEKVSAIGHESTGVPLARRFLRRLTNETRLERYVLNMVELHMRPNILAWERAGRKSTARLFDRSVCPEDLLLLSKADYLGKGNAGDYGPAEAFLRERLSDYREIMSRPFVQGRDLVDAGFKPGPDFTEALAQAHKMRLAGVPKDEALAQTLAVLRKLRGL